MTSAPEMLYVLAQNFLSTGTDCWLTSVCNIVTNDGNDQPPSWESNTDSDCQNPCLGNATEICGGRIQDFFNQGKISGYVTCEFFGRC
jgi:hypothetical protein